MRPLSNCFKLLPRYLSTQAQQLRALAMPFTLDTTAFIIVVAVFQMPLSISSTTRHGSQSQHNPTLTLFEIQMQRTVSRYLLRNTTTQEPEESILQILMTFGRNVEMQGRPITPNHPALQSKPPDSASINLRKQPETHSRCARFEGRHHP
jgi:hypothetical protein